MTSTPKPPVTAELVWSEDLQFGVTSGRIATVVDGDGTAGPSPVQMLVIGLAGCMAIDVLDIIRKGRHTFTAFRTSITATREPSVRVATRCAASCWPCAVSTGRRNDKRRTKDMVRKVGLFRAGRKRRKVFALTAARRIKKRNVIVTRLPNADGRLPIGDWRIVASDS